MSLQRKQIELRRRKAELEQLKKEVEFYETKIGMKVEEIITIQNKIHELNGIK